MAVTVAFLAGYLWGGVPSAYLLARFLRGMDIRKVGSGNVGASNVMAHVGRRTGLGLGLFDLLGKGTLPVAVAGLAGYGGWTQMAAGLGAIAGHNWSPYLKLTGGRGMATVLGVYLGLLLWQEILMVIVVAAVWGWYIRKSLALWLALAMALVPPVAWALDRPAEVVYGSLAALAAILLKRLTANWERPPEGGSLPGVLFRRLVHDRDIASQSDWVGRRARRRGGAGGGA